MSALCAFACVGLAVAAGYIGISRTVAGVALRALTTLALRWLAGRPGP